MNFILTVMNLKSNFLINLYKNKISFYLFENNYSIFNLLRESFFKIKC